MKKGIYLLLLFLAPSLLAVAQTREITGKVVDSSGAPVNATITISQPKTVTKTNEKGEFTLKVPASLANVTFEVTSVGYTTKKETTTGKTPVVVTLEKSVSDLGNITVIQYGYFSQRTKDKTGSIGSVGVKDIKDLTVNSAAEALTGKIAGVSVTATDGAPDADLKITVRQGTSLTQDNKPLTVVDGVIVEDGLNAIAPQDIETIDVLKDASATAVFGARGANGVIVVTTKSGKSGKLSVSYNGFMGWRETYRKIEVLHPYDFVMSQYDRAIITGDLSNFQGNYGSTYDTLINYKNTPFVDWQDEMFGRKAMTQTHNVGLSGGNKNTTFNLSLTSNNDEGVLQGTSFDRKLLTIKIDQKITDKLKVGITSRYNYQVVSGAKVAEEDESQTSNKLRHSVRYRPYILPGQATDFLDTSLLDPNEITSTTVLNPIVANNSEYRRVYKTYLNFTGYLSYKFNNAFSFKSTLGVDTRYQQENLFYGTLSNLALSYVRYQIDSSKSILNLDERSRTSISNSNVLSYTNASSKNRGKNNVDALIGEEIYDLTNKSNEVWRANFPQHFTPDQALSQLNAGVPFTNQLNSSSISAADQRRLWSFFGRVNYDYDKRYYATFSLRADGSSIFAPDKRWGYFPSGSLAWRIVNEKFMEKLAQKSKLSELKLRLSYGESGNNNVPAYYYLNTYIYTVPNTLKPDHLPNPDLKWETTASTNAGIDIGFLKDRITASVDVYKTLTRDLLTEQPVDPSTGFTTQYRNVGKTSSRGVEIQLSAGIIQKKNFTWSASFNIAFASRKLDEFNVGTANYKDYSSGWAGTAAGNDFRVAEGESIGLMYGYIADGFYRASDFNYTGNKYSINDLKPGVAKYQNSELASNLIGPGTMKFKDLNGDGIIDNNDKTVIGNATPKYTGGLTQNFTYRGLDASIFINWVVGNNVLNANMLDFSNTFTKNTNLIAEMKDAWRVTDDAGNDIRNSAPAYYDSINRNAKIWTPYTQQSYPLSSWAIEDGSFLRINNITLGYTFPKEWMSKVKITRFRIYATATNLAVFTNYSGYDPEVNTRTRLPLTPGVDYSAYPKSRTFVFGINLTL